MTSANRPLRQGVLFVISGPSGSGKSTLCKDLIRNCPLPVGLAVSHTTRGIRTGEVDGRDYHFISIDQFKKNIDNGLYLEYANVHGNYYGTPKQAVEEFLARSQHGILEIDVQGGLQVKSVMPKTVLIFVCPPNIAELKDRLSKRATDSPEVIKRRIENAEQELTRISDYDYMVINDVYSEALTELQSILVAERNKVSHLNFEILDDIMQVPKI